MMEVTGKAYQKDAEGVEKLCMSTAGLNALLPCAVAAKDIESWGFKPHARVRAGLWWSVEDVPEILRKLERLIAVTRESL